MGEPQHAGASAARTPLVLSALAAGSATRWETTRQQAALASFGSSTGAHAQATPPPSSAAASGSSATAMAAKTAAAAAELFRDIRRLHEGSALASSCDAMLSTQLERLELQQEKELYRRSFAARNRTSIAVRRRLAHLALLQREASRWTSLLLALIVYLWSELSSRPAETAQVLLAASLRLLEMKCLQHWLMATRQAELGRQMDRLKSQEDARQELREHELGRLQMRYLEIQQRHSISVLRISLASQHSAIESLHLRAWAAHVAKLTERRDAIVKAKVGLKIFQKVDLTVIVRRSFSRWKVWATGVQKVMATARGMAAHLFTMRQQDVGRLVHVAFKSWSHQSLLEGHLSLLEKERSGQCRALGQRMEEVQNKRMRLKDLQMKGSALAGWMDVSKSVLLHAWKQTAKSIRLERQEWHLQQAQRVAEVRVAAVVMTANQAFAGLLALLLQLCLAAWHTQLTMPARVELQRLHAVDTAYEERLEEAQHLVLQGQLQWGISMLHHAALAVNRRQGHSALQRWKLASLQVSLAELRRSAAEKPAQLARLRQEVCARQVETCTHHEAATHAFLRLLHSWQLWVCRAWFAAWVATTDSALRSRRWDREVAILAREAQQMEGSLHEQLRKGAAAAAQLLPALGEAVCLARCLLAWAGLFAEHHLAAQLQEFRYGHAVAEQRVLQEFRQKAVELQACSASSFDAWNRRWDARALLFGVLREWQGLQERALQARHLKRQRVALKATLADELQAAAVAATRRSLRAVLATWSAQRLQLPLSRGWSEVERIERARELTQRRLRALGGMSMLSGQRCACLDVLMKAFLVWRSIAGCATVQRAGEQVCLKLDASVAAEERALATAKAHAGTAVLAAVEASSSHGHVRRFVAALCFPCWRAHAQTERRRKNIVLCEEDNLLQMEKLRRKAEAQQLRWASWAATGLLRGEWRLQLLLVLQKWRRFTQVQRAERDDEWTSAIHTSALDALIERSWDWRRHCFCEWQRLVRKLAVQLLEDELEDMEAAFVQEHGERLAFEEDSLLSSSEDEEESPSYQWRSGSERSQPHGGVRQPLGLAVESTTPSRWSPSRISWAAESAPATGQTGQRLDWSMAGSSSGTPYRLPTAAASAILEQMAPPTLTSFAARLQQHFAPGAATPPP